MKCPRLYKRINGQTLNVRLLGKSVRESESTEDLQHNTIHSLAGETSNKMYASRLTPFQRIMIQITHGSKLPYDRSEKRN